jgi:hypothetical protein
MKINSIFLISILVCISCLSIKCIHEEAALTQGFYYPENLYPNCEYYGRVDIWGAISEVKKRRIDIIVENKDKKIFLKDTLNIIGKEVNAYVNWSNFDKIKIVFWEGPSMRKIDYEIKQDSIPILRIVNYLYNTELHKFYRAVNNAN